uniref:Spermidine synthase n=1 Tax=Desulfatirhabdium butyrativorans TaxID=340467 RepID=A0A7C4MQD1_9BACT
MYMTFVSAGLMLIALTTLMLELTLIRVFDVIWTSNLAYMVITCAMFCIGLAGVISTIKPISTDSRPNRILAFWSIFYGISALSILPILNGLSKLSANIFTHPIQGILYSFCIYSILAVPFFSAGMIFSVVFSAFSEKIQSLYFWDLTGAALGCIVLIPILPLIGPGGILFLAFGFCLIAAACFIGRKTWLLLSLGLTAALVSIPILNYPKYIDFKEHSAKRSLLTWKERGRIEKTVWDPISKIDVIDITIKKWIAYDGGTQTSYIYPFDGNHAAIRQGMPEGADRHFWERMVLISHFLKRDSNQRVLVIGSAGGQETRAALMYGAGHIDAIELVDTVVRLGKETYARYAGYIFNDPRVNAQTGEGRSYLRTVQTPYDIIQIFSNHTSSSIAAGNGALESNYLQTAEAYKDYFDHLSPNGILHINHHIYPRIVTTAARGWKMSGRTDFQHHVAVYEAPGVQDNLPTILIKMSPWTSEELEEANRFFHGNRVLVEHPLAPEKSFLSAEFYSGEMSEELLDRIPFRIDPPTDDRPYFGFLRKHAHPLHPDPKSFLNLSTAMLLNAQLTANGIPMDWIHLFVTGAASILFSIVFLFVPLLFSQVGRSPWSGKGYTLAYFSCLGAGFILIELMFIQLFMKVIGYPLYTYAAVVFSLLAGAGSGSYLSGRIGVQPDNRWHIPFWGIITWGLVLLTMHDTFFRLLLAEPTWLRIGISFLLILPLGFFMGMPFPLGILAIRNRHPGTIAWVWAMNGFFTVIGGLISVLLAIRVGYQWTLLLALTVYAVAALLFVRLQQKEPIGGK